jgi:PadR family transcriptional regulator PadR
MREFYIGEFEEVVLLTVGILHGNAYGVTIRDEIEKEMKRKVSIGSLQVTLRRLESKGFLKSIPGESEEARRGRPKLFFELTAYGKKAIEINRESRNNMWRKLPRFILRLQ